jgi:propionyl-CoA carboxylase alpha chain
VERAADGEHYSVLINGETYPVITDWSFGQPLFVGTVKGEAVTVQVDGLGVGYRLFHNGAQAEARVYTPKGAELAKVMPKKLPPDLSKFLLSPMPGLLVTVAVSEGQEVKAGETLAVVEAMKMENVLKCEQDGTVKKIHGAPGASLAVDEIIIEFE